MEKDERHLEEYITRLDATTKPGIFVVRLKENVSRAALNKMCNVLDTLVKRYCAASTVLVLPPSVGSVRKITDAELEECGFVRKSV